MPTESGRSSRGSGKAAPAASPTLRRWELAARIRELRLAAGKSVDEVASELMCSAAKISRMETAGRGVQARDIRDLSQFYRLPPEVHDELMRLVEEAKKPAWWQEYKTLPAGTSQIIGLETSASDIRVVQGQLVPGLLQTPEYSAWLFKGIRSGRDLDPESLKEWVEVRQRRQELLLDPSFSYACVIDESALARRIGSETVMAGQVLRLLEATDLPSVKIQVVPFSKGSYGGLEGSFQWMRFRTDRVSDMVVLEDPLDIRLLEKDQEVAVYREIYDHIAEHVALSSAETRDWLSRFAS